MIDVLGNTMKHLEAAFSPTRDVQPTYYDLEFEGAMMGWQEDSLHDVKSKAQEWYAAKCMDKVPTMKNGDTMECDAFILGFDEDGEQVSRDRYGLFFEYYHGDLKEHGTMGKTI